jgi:hypothetical protein
MASTLLKHRDPNTLSNYDQYLTTHTSVNYSIDFEKKRLSGHVVLTLKAVGQSGSTEVVLDSSFLDVKDVKVDGAIVKWDLPARTEPYGSPLKIHLGKAVKPDQVLEIYVSEVICCGDFHVNVLLRLPLIPRRAARLCSGSRRNKLRIRSIPICVSIIYC